MIYGAMEYLHKLQLEMKIKKGNNNNNNSNRGGFWSGFGNNNYNNNSGYNSLRYKINVING